MNEKIKKSDTPHFDYGISNSYDMFIKLHYEGEKLSEECNPYDCFNFFVTAWHLYDDWLEKDINRPKLALEKRGRTPELMRNLLFVFKDLTNGSKHMTLKPKNYKKKVITKIYPPIIGSWRAYFSNKKEIYVTVDNYTYSMWDIRYIAIHYFTWIFDDSIPANHFPIKAQAHLERGLVKR